MFRQQGDQSLEDSLQLAVRAALVVDVAQAGGDKGGQRRRGNLSDQVRVFPRKHKDADQSNDGEGTSSRWIGLLEESEESFDPWARFAKNFQASSLDCRLDQDHGRPSAFNGAILE